MGRPPCFQTLISNPNGWHRWAQNAVKLELSILKVWCYFSLYLRVEPTGDYAEALGSQFIDLGRHFLLGSLSCREGVVEVVVHVCAADFKTSEWRLRPHLRRSNQQLPFAN